MLDIALGQRLATRCDGQSRRDFLRVGALAPFGLSLASLLSAQSAQAATAANPVRRGPHARSVLLVFLGGGISHHDTFDPKPDAVSDIRGQYGTIPTRVAGLHISDQLPRLAHCMDKLCLVRSGTHENDHHETATNWVLSGRFGSPFGDHPSIGSVVAHETGFAGQLPPYVAVPKNPSFTWELGRSAWLGGRFESFKAGDPNDKGWKVRDLSRATGLPEGSAERRQTLLQAVDTLSARVRGNDQVATYDEFSRKATEMVLSSGAQQAFALDREGDRIRDEYGRTEFGQSCLLARRLVEGGVRFVTVNYGGWDHHAKIYEGLGKKLPEFDRGLSALVHDLDRRGLLSETLLVVMGEFGRTPKINKDAGRDHWGRAGSMLFAGAGVQGGRVIGATDRDGAFVTDRPVRPADVAWTVYESLGIDPRKLLFTPEGRPVEILDQGSLITDLFA
jgi:hypothetical protein